MRTRVTWGRIQVLHQKKPEAANSSPAGKCPSPNQALAFATESCLISLAAAEQLKGKGGFGENTPEKVIMVEIMKKKKGQSVLPASNTSLFHHQTLQYLFNFKAALRCHQETLTVIINGTVLIISRMNEMRKICSQMFP